MATSLQPEDVVDVLTIIAAFDQRTLGDADVIAWSAALDPAVTRADAETAAAEHYAVDSRRISVADVNNRCRAIRRQRVKDAGEPNWPDVAAAAEITWRRARTDAIAAGETVAQAERFADRQIGYRRPAELPTSPRPVAALIGSRTARVVR